MSKEKSVLIIFFPFNMATQKKFVYNEEDDMEGGQYHPLGMLVTTIGGPNPNKTSYSFMYSILVAPAGVGPNRVTTLSRFENKNKW